MMYERFCWMRLNPILPLISFFVVFTDFGKKESRNKCGRKQQGAENLEMLFLTLFFASSI